MALEARLVPRQEQRLHLSQQMLQNLEFLLLPALDLREHILKEVEENPLLEVQEAENPGTEKPTEAEATAEETARDEALQKFEEQWVDTERCGRRRGGADASDARQEMLENIGAGRGSLRAHLREQLSHLELDRVLRAWCEYVIEWVDEAGYVRSSAEEMAGAAPGELLEGPDLEPIRKIEAALRIIRSLGPRGVGSRTLQECLLAQLDPTDADYPLLRRIVERHLEDAGRNRLPRIAQALLADPESESLLGYPAEPDPDDVLDDVKRLIRRLGGMNPKPGRGFSVDDPGRVYPEVTILLVEGAYEIEFEESWLPAVTINREYAEMLAGRPLTLRERGRVFEMARGGRFVGTHAEALSRAGLGEPLGVEDRSRMATLMNREDLKEDEHRLIALLAGDRGLSEKDRQYLKGKLQSGRKLIAAIEQRRGTLHRVVRAILERQKEYFDRGVEHLRPLRMQEVADAVGVHVSTVSRAAAGKWMATPRGILPMKFFFAAPVSGLQDAPCEGARPEPTRAALLQMIRTVVEEEDPEKPISDSRLTRRLWERYGIRAARRSVAKYREGLGIGSSMLRRRY